MVPLLLWVQVDFVEKGRIEKFRNGDLEALADLVYDPQFYRVIGTGDEVVQGGFGNAAFCEQLVLGHAPLLKKLGHPLTDCLIQLHIHPTFVFLWWYYMKS